MGLTDNILRFQIWTLPTADTFEKLLPDDLEEVATATGTRELSGWSDNSMSVPTGITWLTDWAGGWIRAYLGDTLIDEFLAERLHQPTDRPGMVTISGPQANGIVEKCGVYPYKWPNHAVAAPDWNWGSERNLIRNGDASENPDGMPNAGFEDGTAEPWQAGAVDGVSATLDVVTTDPNDGTYHAEVEALLDEGGMSVQRNVAPGRLYTFGINAKTPSGSHDWQLGAAGEGVLSAPGGAYMPTDGRAEALLDAEFTNSAYAEESMQFVAGPAQTSVQLNVRYIGGSAPQTLYVDDIIWSGFGVGTDGWEYTNGIADFQVIDDSPPAGYDQYFRAVAGAGHSVYEPMTGIAPGSTLSYQLLATGPADGHIWTVEVRDVRGRRIHQKTITLDADEWDTFTGTFTLPAELPGDGRIEFHLVNHHQGQSTILYTGVQLFEGEPAATATKIVRQLLEAAQERGTFEFLDLDFTDSVDTAGTSLDPISFSVRWGAGVTLGTVLSALHQQGYEWRIIAKDTPADGQTHDLQLWAPGGGPADHTADTDGPVVLTGPHTPEGSVTRRIPAYTSVLVHGDGVMVEDTNDTTEATYGRWETTVDAEPANSADTAQAVADATFANEEANREALSAIVFATDQTVPLVDYSEGDKMYWHYPGLVAPVAKRVRRISWDHGTPARFTLQGSRTLTPSGALAVAVRNLLLEPKRRGGRSGTARAIAPPSLIEGDAGFGARIYPLLSGGQAIADDTPVAIMFNALDVLGRQRFPDPDLPADEIPVQVPSYYNVRIDDLQWLTPGVWDWSVSVIRVRAGTEVTVWPPTLSTEWSGSVHGGFTGVASAIPFEPGDKLKVYVHQESGTSQTLASAVVSFYAVDRTGAEVASAATEATVLSTQTGVTSTATTLAWPLPDYRSGDICFVAVTGASGASPTWTLTGWTLEGSVESTESSLYIFSKVMDGSEGSTVSVAVDTSVSASGVAWLVRSGVDYSSVAPDTQGPAQATWVAPTVTPSHGAAEYLCFVVAGGSNFYGVSGPSGFDTVETVDNPNLPGGDPVLHVSMKAISTGGSVAPGTVTYTSDAGSGRNNLVASILVKVGDL